jgi:hypothetical protein
VVVQLPLRVIVFFTVVKEQAALAATLAARVNVAAPSKIASFFRNIH